MSRLIKLTTSDFLAKSKTLIGDFIVVFTCWILTCLDDGWYCVHTFRQILFISRLDTI